MINTLHAYNTVINCYFLHKYAHTGFIHTEKKLAFMDKNMRAHNLSDVSKNRDHIVHKWRQLYSLAIVLHASL
jgi:hypothetical protein